MAREAQQPNVHHRLAKDKPSRANIGKAVFLCAHPQSRPRPLFCAQRASKALSTNQVALTAAKIFEHCKPEQRNQAMSDQNGTWWLTDAKNSRRCPSSLTTCALT